MEGDVLEVPEFIPYIQKSSKQMSFSFAYDATKVWNKLLDDIHSATSLLSNLIYCFAGAISSPQRGTQCANLTKIIIIRRAEGRSRSVIRSCGCDQEGRN